MPRFEGGVVMWRMHPAIEAAIAEIDSITKDVAGRPAIITAARDGEHMDGSLHYEGAAIDLRNRDMTAAQKMEYHRRLAEHFGPLGFDFVREPTHEHGEFDPK